MSRAKYWCFTLNNYTDVELDLVRGLEQHEDVTYLICGKERGDNETPHLQGYLELKRRFRIRQLKQLPGLTRAHFEPRKGTQAQAADYCTKEGDFFEIGTKATVQQGKRSDLDRALDTIRGGGTIKSLWEEHPKVMIRYEKGMRAAIKHLRPKKEKKKFDLESFPWHPLILEAGKSWLLWGDSGIGKTSYVRSRFPDFLWVTHMDDLATFDEGEHGGIIFDDMCFTHLPRTAQIHLVDQDDDRTIHIRYMTAHIPAGTPKVFTSNTEFIFNVDSAINRRLAVYKLEGDVI